MYDYDLITIEDCIEMYKYKDTCVILNDGKVVGWEPAGGNV